MIDNLDALNPQQRRRVRTSRAKAMGTHNDVDWSVMVAVCGYRCVMCRADGLRDTVLQKDHVISIRDGGCDCIANLQPLCTRCNTIKGCGSADYRPKGWSDRFNTVLGKIRTILGEASL